MNNIEWSGEFVEISWPAAATALVILIVAVFLKQLVCSDKYKLYIIDTDGTGGPRLIRGQKDGHHRMPDWSPDGKWVAYVSDLDP